MRYAVLIAALLAATSLVATANTSSRCEHGSLTHSWRAGDSEIFACSYGNEPRKVGGDRWRASGITFYRGNQNHGSREIIDSSEAKPPIEYSVKNGKLTLLVYTYDPRSSSPEILFRRVIPVAGIELEPTLEVVLRPPSPDPARVEQILSALSAPRPLDSDQFLDRVDHMLFELRNYGLRDPQSMSTRLHALGSPWWRDGHAAESLTEVLEELELVQQSRTRAP